MKQPKSDRVASYQEELNEAINRLRTATRAAREELDEVQRLTELLSDLQVETVRSDRWTRESISPIRSIRTERTTREEYQGDYLLGGNLRVGDRVRILNPNLGQPNQGVVEGAGSLYIHVRGPNRRLIKRVARNLAKINRSNNRRSL